MAEKHDPKVAQAGQATAQRAIVANGPVAVQFGEILEDQVDVIGRHRSIRMPRNLDDLPGREIAVDLLLETDKFAAHAPNLLAMAQPAVGVGLELGEEILHLVDFLLEWQPQ